jgi:homoserine O-acetyltransferase/O-succinyltransferase
MTTTLALDNPGLVAPPHTLRVEERLALDCGRVLPEHTVSFETYGTLAPARDNAILVCHSLTKGAHAAGRHAPGDPRPGWWDAAIGPGKLLDTNRYFVICAETLAAGRSTGPASPDPATGRPYGLRFPVVTVRDMVHAQQQLITRLGIERLHAVIGGCFGGQQAIEWAIQHPGQVGNAVVITTTPATSAHSIAIFAVMRRLIRGDPAWNGGDYYGESPPAAGLGAAIAAAVPLWMSAEAMDARFARRLATPAPASPAPPATPTPASPAPSATPTGRSYTLEAEFEVESFIARLAAQSVHQLDPNSLMYLTRAVEYFDLEAAYGSLERALAPVSARVLFLSYRKDWRYPAAETDRMHQALRARGADSRHVVLDSGLGHGAFLFDVAGLAGTVADFLDQQNA